MLKVGLGKRPSRPSPTSPSWVEWGFTEATWSLMKDCWQDDPTKRPSADVVAAHLSNILDEDTRPSGSWRDFSSTQFQDAIGVHPHPTIDALEAMLWGTSTSIKI
jgi:hypothetical protein